MLKALDSILQKAKPICEREGIDNLKDTILTIFLIPLKVQVTKNKERKVTKNT